MKRTSLTIITLAFILLLSLNFASAITVDANYITVYPGEQGKVTLKIDNNENFDMNSISASINFANLPFSSVGSSEKSVDDINNGDDDSVPFSIKASSDAKPGDYEIPYLIKYTNSKTDNAEQKTGTFGIRVSAKTELDFSVEAKGIDTESPIFGKNGKISLEIINRGLGNIKSVNVKLTASEFELLSKDNVFIGTISADDTDLASFNVIYKSTNPKLKAEVTYKDFDNKDQAQNVEIPFKVYIEQEALQLGLIKRSNTMIYLIVIIVLIAAWIF
ncbi:hypothetical protein HY212_07190 [Candidatus Pacearchaeota archaeon]|nr:hypothetical protein [Candidatus Pacearchaeota archaeon]